MPKVSRYASLCAAFFLAGCPSPTDIVSEGDICTTLLFGNGKTVSVRSESLQSVDANFEFISAILYSVNIMPPSPNMVQIENRISKITISPESYYPIEEKHVGLKGEATCLIVPYGKRRCEIYDYRSDILVDVDFDSDNFEFLQLDMRNILDYISKDVLNCRESSASEAELL